MQGVISFSRSRSGLFRHLLHFSLALVLSALNDRHVAGEGSHFSELSISQSTLDGVGWGRVFVVSRESTVFARAQRRG